MEIIYDPKFIGQFTEIWDFISLDSQNRANKFKHNLKEKIQNLENMPFKYRQSIYFDNQNIRDLIYKGYIIPYKIDLSKNTILILGITKYKKDF